ncbi:type III pantothenate kinase [Pseudoflavonifractor sp. 524-17]|uniref:type III pantothenate kinase n=1 Tax=Pseudoflavonifractor sp. 524-17 TaxID=2304577 RepID=UPI00137AE75E|nr:type III pantothenate kinase [Pseudoflavonifractor sp. 524-17]NCE63382.1 type III pantothenate kinase [Pseudoflavonifractor sp. 524-17]
MLLTVDIGNTNMVFGIFEGERLAGSFRLRTEANQTSDEIGLLVWGYFERFGLDASAVENVVIASVVPQVMYSVNSAMVKYLGRRPLVVDDTLDPGLPYGVESDERLGPDRAVACVGALARFRAPLIVLDFGTATTLDAVDRQGRYIGGCITAGVRVSIDALFQRTAMLPHVELAKPEKVLGTTAVGQIQAGAVIGYMGAMEHLIRQAKEEMGEPDAKVVATGGLARMVAESSTLIDVVDSHLVLDGLRIVYNRQR